MARPGSKVADAEYITDMLIPLTYDEAQARYARLGYGESLPWSREDIDGDDQLLFTCKHWDEDARLCDDYANRPRMCRDYPYGRSCERKCGYDYDPNPSPFLWDEAAKGWRVQSNGSWLWDAEAQLLTKAPDA
jgi:Fe-S-cluster containining protein